MKVFISYSFEDENKFKDVCYAFEHDGIDYWKVDEIVAGQSLRDKLQNAIKRCSVCVLIATTNSLKSVWCQAEIGAFWGAGKPVVIYLAGDKLNESDLPKQFKGDKFATSIREVVAAMKIHLSELAETSQTEVIFNLAVDSFIDKLTLQFMTNRFVGFGSLAPGFDRGTENSLRTTNAFGNRVSYDIAKVGDEAESELKSVIKRIPNLRRDREREIIKVLFALLAETQGQGQIITDNLSKIPYESTTLAEPWREAQERILKLWKDKSHHLIFFRTEELGRLRIFLEEHPAYQQVYTNESAAIETFLKSGEMSLDELIEITKNELKESLRNALVAQGLA